MNKIDNLSEERLTRVLAYAGLVLVAFELSVTKIKHTVKINIMQ